jgi:phosphoribosylglycinamide formyltransferase-1
VLRVVILISGQGTNAAEFIKGCQSGKIPAQVVAVGSDLDAPGLGFAKSAGIANFVEPFSDSAERHAWGERLADRVAGFNPDLVILSGFMRLVPPVFVQRFAPRLLNTHPSLLPNFPGAHAVRDALAAGVTETGASVILVDDGVDTGPILAQRKISIEAADTEETLHSRIKVVERELLAEVVSDLNNRENRYEGKA